MDNGNEAGKPIVDQVLEVMLNKLEGREEFNPEVMKHLRDLAKSSGLRKHAEVARAISSEVGQGA